MGRREIPMGKARATEQYLGMTQTAAAIPLDRGADLPAVAAQILDAGLWCMIETPLDGDWEPRLLICHRDEARVVAAVEEWVGESPAPAARIAGYTRGTLRRVDEAPTATCPAARPVALA
jgi:hypothetical protein